LRPLDGPSPTLRASASLGAALCVSAIVFAFVAETEMVARGSGKTVPMDSVRLVQSQIAGKVMSLDIRDGDGVGTGQVLARLDDTQQRAELASLRLQIDRTRAVAARMTAALAGLQRLEKGDANPVETGAQTSATEWHSDPTGVFSAGLWSSAVWSAKVNYTEDDFCLLLEGTVALTDAAGHTETYEAGDAFLIPAGFTGVWSSLTPVRKLYVMHQARKE
jgi:uncharacterized protein